MDRFTFSTYIPEKYCQEKIINQTKFYLSYIYDLYIEITYDEDNKLVQNALYLTSCTKVLILTLDFINKHLFLSIIREIEFYSLRRQALFV